MVPNLVHYPPMVQVNMHDAKTHLSRYIKQVQAGEVVVLCIRNVPVAEIRALPAERSTPRPVGLETGHLEIPDSFFEPLPDAVLSGFEGLPA